MKVSRYATELPMALRRADMIGSALERYQGAKPTADQALTIANYDNLFRLEADLEAVLVSVRDAIEATSESIKRQARQAYCRSDRGAA